MQTNVPGVYDKPPSEEGARLIREIGRLKLLVRRNFVVLVHARALGSNFSLVQNEDVPLCVYVKDHTSARLFTSALFLVWQLLQQMVRGPSLTRMTWHKVRESGVLENPMLNAIFVVRGRLFFHICRLQYNICLSLQFPG
jgi:hypothetical protein